jgi:Sec-independent protein secretion pathway component TatC
VPLCLLYELTLIATWFTQRRRKREADAETEAA